MLITRTSTPTLPESLTAELAFKRAMSAMVRAWHMRPCGQLGTCEWAFGEVNPSLCAVRPYLLPCGAAKYESLLSSVADLPHNINQKLFGSTVIYRGTNDDLYKCDLRLWAGGCHRVEFES